MKWTAKCEICNEENLRNRKPIINVRVCCNRAHKWVMQND